MSAFPMSIIRDNFADNAIADCWTTAITGSAVVAEVGGQAVITLPSSTVGTHVGYYRSSGRFDLTGSSFYINIAQMVSTSVAARMLFQLIDLDNTSGQLFWQQISGTLSAIKSVPGVGTTTLYSVAWNASTYRYLRIRESGGNVFFDSSTDGVTWTNRATTTTTTPLTSLAIQVYADCGNVASPGSLKLDDVNLILPALSTNWRWTRCTRTTNDRYRTITLSGLGGQAYIVTADSLDAAGAYVNPRFFSGPIGSASGAYLQLTEYSNQSDAMAMAVNFPPLAFARWDLPTLVDCRIVTLHHRSITGSSYALGEAYPRRTVESDDILAESIQAINIAAGAITADKITVLSLAALSAQMGALHMDGVIDIASTGGIYQGTGTFASPTTGLKLFNNAGVGKLAGYNAGVEQASFDTDGKIKAGAGSVVLDENGISIVSPTSALNRAKYKFVSGSTPVSELGAAYVAGSSNAMLMQIPFSSGESATIGIYTSSALAKESLIDIQSTVGGSGSARIQLRSHPGGTSDIIFGADSFSFGGNIQNQNTLYAVRSGGSALFALDAATMGSPLSIANNTSSAALGGVRNFSGLLIISETAVNGNCAMFLVDGGG